MERLAEFALGAGEMLLVSGAEMARVEDTVYRILRAGGWESPEVFALPTGIFIAARDIKSVSAMHRVTEHRTDLRRFILINQLSREFCAGRKTLKEAEEELSRIREVRDYGFAVCLLGYALVCGFFAVMFGGGCPEALAAGLVGFLLCAVLQALPKYAISDFIRMLLGGLTVGLSALLLQRFLWQPLHADPVVMGSIMPLVPGATLTTAIRDTINGDYAAGTARFAEAVVMAMAIATGVAMSMLLSL